MFTSSSFIKDVFCNENGGDGEVHQVNRPPPGSRRIRCCSRRGCPRCLPWRANRAGTTGLRSEKKGLRIPSFERFQTVTTGKASKSALILAVLGERPGSRATISLQCWVSWDIPMLITTQVKRTLCKIWIFKVIKYSLKCGQPACKRMAVWFLLLPSGTPGPSSTWLVPL